MRRRLFDVGALLSAILWIDALALWGLAFVVNPWDHHLSITHSFHIGVLGDANGPLPARLVLFNDAEYGPYQGSIIGLVDQHGNPTRPMTQRAWGDAWGIYYRYFHWLDTGDTLWTLMVSLGYPLAIFAVAPGVWAWRRIRWRRQSGTAGDAFRA